MPNKGSQPQRLLTYARALREALEQSMAVDPSVFVIGEGVPDPKGIFGSTKDLQKKYGRERVMDMPVSENALTGVCIGAALRGMRPVITHQRVDFSLLALDQIINNAAKWFFMFGSQASVPMVARMIIGRGWGQGAQHSQSLQALFAHISGLKVIMPATAHDAKGMLVAAIRDNNPVICLEHRWLYGLRDHVPEELYTVDLGRAQVMRSGEDVTIVAASHMTVESLKACRWLEKQGVKPEIIDLRTVSPLDTRTIIDSVVKTGRLLVADTGAQSFGIGAEIVARVMETCFDSLKAAPRRIGTPDYPSPSSPRLAEKYYPTYPAIARAVYELLDRDQQDMKTLTDEACAGGVPHDVPDLTFQGPF